MCAVIDWQGGQQSICDHGLTRMPHGWTGLAQSKMEQAGMVQVTVARLRLRVHGKAAETCGNAGSVRCGTHRRRGAH